MNSSTVKGLAAISLVVLSASTQLCAQDRAEPGQKRHHRYRFVGVGTLGGSVTQIFFGTVGTDQCSIGFSINSAQQVVGISSPDCTFAEANAFLWEGGDP